VQGDGAAGQESDEDKKKYPENPVDPV